jgi:hypothetical protein
MSIIIQKILKVKHFPLDIHSGNPENRGILIDCQDGLGPDWAGSGWAA